MTPRIVHIVPDLTDHNRLPTLQRLFAAAQAGPFHHPSFVGHEQTVIGWGRPQSLSRANSHSLLAGNAADSSPLLHLSARHEHDGAAAFRLVQWLQDIRPQVIHVWSRSILRMLGGCLSLLEPPAAPKLSRTKLVATIFSSRPHPSVLVRQLDRVAAQRFHSIITATDANRNELIALGWQPTSNCPWSTIQPATFDLTGEQTDASNATGDSRRFQPPAGAVLIGVPGPLERVHRLKDAVWAGDLLKVARDDTHVLIFGRGPHAKRLKKFRDQVAIQDRVHFLPAEPFTRWLPKLDYIWLPSRHLVNPAAALLATASGIPIVASDVAAHRELLGHDYPCLNPVGNRSGLARKTYHMLVEPEFHSSAVTLIQSRNRTSTAALLAAHAEVYFDQPETHVESLRKRVVWKRPYFWRLGRKQPKFPTPTE